MSTIYRKSGDRIFYKVEGNFVTRVTNKFFESGVIVTRNVVIKSEAMDDSDPSTESEFATAYKEAMERITSGVI